MVGCATELARAFPSRALALALVVGGSIVIPYPRCAVATFEELNETQA